MSNTTDYEALRVENERLKAENAAIRQSEERYEALFKALPVSLEVVDREGMITSVNPFHLDHMGRGRTKQEDYVGRYLVTRASIVASGLSESILRVLRGEPFESPEVHFPALSGGGEGWFNVRGVPLRSNGKIVGAIFISEDVSTLKEAKDELGRHKEKLEEMVEARTAELKEALGRVKTLSGFLPICASCKKIRDDKGYWSQVEEYISLHAEVEFSHGLCPACSERLYPGYELGEDDEAPSP
jgi:PAS domain S-box-containing protein